LASQEDLIFASQEDLILASQEGLISASQEDLILASKEGLILASQEGYRWSTVCLKYVTLLNRIVHSRYITEYDSTQHETGITGRIV
jgi:hypothetical protein